MKEFYFGYDLENIEEVMNYVKENYEDRLIEIGRNGVKVNDVNDDIMYGIMMMVKKCREGVSEIV